MIPLQECDSPPPTRPLATQPYANITSMCTVPRSIVLDASVLLAAGDDENESPSLGHGADYVLRKLRYSNIFTGISYGHSLSALRSSAIDNFVSEVSLEWSDNIGSYMHVVSSYKDEEISQLISSGWLVTVLHVEYSPGTENPSRFSLTSFEELPLTVCHLNKKMTLPTAFQTDLASSGRRLLPSICNHLCYRPSGRPSLLLNSGKSTLIGAGTLYLFSLVVLRKGLHQASFASTPFHFKQSTLFSTISAAISVKSSLPLLFTVVNEGYEVVYCYKKLTAFYAKTADDIITVEMSSSSDLENKVTYSEGMQELQRRISGGGRCLNKLEQLAPQNYTLPVY
ncbi:hypothetical protein HAX54_024148 [Datura stramonium]|uniref:Uncharacterized protein n=1 Tax=Datura stramonium TaxID=4076 RepID=A0ABS8S7C4_DATST|nr:hypothetical protein [Datura stramonium]